MAKSLVIVESPAKAKTINRYLGAGYTVKASMGHVMDLPKKELGVDLKNNFKPNYEVIPSKKETIKSLKSAAKDADTIYLAADPDREGEAICASCWTPKRGNSIGCFSTRSPAKPFARLLKIPRKSIPGWLTPSRRGAFWTAWSVTRLARCCGTR